MPRIDPRVRTATGVASLVAFVAALAAPRALRSAGGALSVGAQPVLVGEWLFVLAFGLALVTAAVTWWPGEARTRRHTVTALLLLLLTGLGVLLVAVFVFADID